MTSVAIRAQLQVLVITFIHVHVLHLYGKTLYCRAGALLSGIFPMIGPLLTGAVLQPLSCQRLILT